MIDGRAVLRHADDILLQHVQPIFVKERVAAAQRGQRFQVQKWVQDLMNPDILGQIDPAGRGQEGSAGEGRLKWCNRDFLALGGWCRGGTACTSGSVVGFGRHRSFRGGGQRVNDGVVMDRARSYYYGVGLFSQVWM